MNLEDALQRLEALDAAKVRAQSAKQGAGKKQFGVKLGDIRKVALHLALRPDLDEETVRRQG